MNMSQSQQIAGAGGVVLVICLFLSWFDPFNGWESFTAFDIYLLITAGVAIGWAAMGSGDTSIPGVTRSGATCLLGATAFIIVLWVLLFDFPDGADRGIGILLSVPATAAIAYGGYRSA